MIEMSNNGKVGQMPLPLYTTAFPQLSSVYPLGLASQADIQANHLISKDSAASRRQLVQAGQQFEAYFISYLMKVMRETVPQGAIANKQGAYFQSFYDQEIGLRAAEAGGIGIARMVQEYAEKYFSYSAPQASSASR